MPMQGFEETSKMIFGLSRKEKAKRRERKKKKAEEKKRKREHELDERMRKQLRDAGFDEADIESLMRKKKKNKK